MYRNECAIEARCLEGYSSGRGGMTLLMTFCCILKILKEMVSSHYVERLLVRDKVQTIGLSSSILLHLDANQKK